MLSPVVVGVLNENPDELFCLAKSPNPIEFEAREKKFSDLELELESSVWDEVLFKFNPKENEGNVDTTSAGFVRIDFTSVPGLTVSQDGQMSTSFVLFM